MESSFFNSLDDCKFIGMHIECKTIMTPIITDEGVCYAFNVLDRKYIFRDDV